MLRIYNTLTGKKEPFEPLAPKTVRMYVCGVTVYDYCHIGHARSALVFDVIRRYLEYSGYRVEFVKNFTDVDDKIIKRANEQGIACEVITAKYIDAYHEDMGKLGVRQATVEPKATEHMADIMELTGTLLNKGLAYQVDGDVYFDVAKYTEYGRLSKRRVEDQQAGARVEVDERPRASASAPAPLAAKLVRTASNSRAGSRRRSTANEVRRSNGSGVTERGGGLRVWPAAPLCSMDGVLLSAVDARRDPPKGKHRVAARRYAS